MGQAGKGLDHTNPSSPGSRKPALGTGGHYPSYSAGPGDPGGLGGRPARERRRQRAPAGVGTSPGLAAGLGRWMAVCAFALTNVSDIRVPTGRIYTSRDTGEKERAASNLVRGQCATFVHPASRPHCTVPPQAGAAGPRLSLRH